MGLKERIARLELEVKPRKDRFILPSGEVVEFTLPDDALEALECAFEDRPHFLLDAANQIVGEDAVIGEGLAGLLWAAQGVPYEAEYRARKRALEEEES